MKRHRNHHDVVTALALFFVRRRIDKSNKRAAAVYLKVKAQLVCVLILETLYARVDISI